MLTNLKHLRQMRGMSQQELADLAGCSQQAIDKYENGLAEPGLDILFRISDAFDVSIDYLVRKTDNPYDGKRTYFSELKNNEIKLIEDLRTLKEDEVKLIYNAVDQFKKYNG